MALPAVAGMLLKYGLGPLVGFFGAKSQANAQKEGDAAMTEYYNRALDAATEEQNYRRGFDEDERTYSRGFNEENQRYGRYSDTYGRASDEERLWYDRGQDIRDKNYGYQQYGNFVETLEPYRAGGSAAASRMSQLMGGPATPDSGSYHNLARTARESVQAVPNVPDRPTWNYAGSGQTPASAAQPAPVSTTMPVDRRHGEIVILESPDGERREVPADQAPYFESRGARRV